MIQLTKTSSLVFFHTFSVYGKVALFSQSPATVMAGLSTSVQVQFYDGEGARSTNDIRLPRNTSTSLKLVSVPPRRILG